MPAKEILHAIADLRAAGWRVELASGHAHVYAVAYCPGNHEGCPPRFIYGTPRVPENEARKIRKWIRDCEHANESEEE